MEHYFNRDDFHADPIAQFHRWYEEARQTDIALPHAMTLATATGDGRPSARMVLLDEADAHGFTFFSNYNSHKGGELAANPFAALVFYWDVLRRQVRIEGRVEKVAREESAAYFATRPRDSQLGAWASPQSEVIANRQVLERRIGELEGQYAGADVPCPPFWGGYRVVPTRIEFWASRQSRLHDCFCYARRDDTWEFAQLAP